MVHNVAAKLSPKFQGSFKLVEFFPQWCMSLEGVRVEKIHVKDLKPYLLPSTYFNPQLISIVIGIEIIAVWRW